MLTLFGHCELQGDYYLPLSAGALCSGDIHFTQSVYSVTVNETAPPEYPRPIPGFINVSCIGYTPITYTIEHSHSASSNLPFQINPVTGEINATADLDYDSLDEGFEFHSFNVSCSDTAGNTSTALVEVYVQPVNEFAPQIEDPDLVLSIDETTPNGTLLLSSLPGGLKRIRVEDRDRGQHGVFNFTLLTALDDHFTFDPLHANLTLVREIDFDIESSISTYLYQELLLKIRVCDCTTPANACRIVNFPLFLVASNDNKPSFLMDAYSTAINETISVGSTVLVLECYDADVRVGEISSIAMLNPSSLVQDTFSLGNLSSNDSVEVILSKRLDYDRLDHFYQFQVSCSDSLHSTTVNVSISVLPENDEVPIFTSEHYQFTVTQATPPGTTVGQVTAVDSDIDSGQNVSYSILQPTGSVFSIDSVTGEIVVNTSLENLTAFSMLVLTVSASDGDLQTTVDATVNITAGNFHSPTFLQEPFSLVMVNDLIEVGAEVINLTCTDNDSGPAGNIIYSLTPSHEKFYINPGTGVVSVTSSLQLPLNSNDIQEYQLTVQCMDHGLPPGTDEIVVIVQVYRSDIIPPSFMNLTGRTQVSEGAEVESEIVTLTASDDDTAFLSFRIVNQTLPGTFTLEQTESKSSSLRLGAALDYENISVHIVTVEVMELREVPGEPQRDVAEITVHVVDENDHRPQLVQPLEEVTLHIHDREPEGTVLIAILCHDDDSGSNAELMYTLHTSSTQAEEMLNISSSGHLVVGGVLQLPDFVLATTYSASVSCSDRGDPPLTSLHNATVVVHITKLDVEPPVFYEADVTIRIPENTSWPTSIYTLAAYDVDSPGIVYNISSDYPTIFTLDSTTAQLILSAPLDSETTPTYTITLIAVEQHMDGSHGNMALTNLTIHVLDINDNAPTFLNSYNESIVLPDSTPPNDIIHSVECRDEDESSNGDIVYEILPQHHLFAVDVAGNILVHMPLDLPDFTLQETHNISILCRDMGVPPLSSTKTITVTVTKTDQQPPVVNISHTSTSLPEGAPRGTRVFTLSVYDVDSQAVSLAIINQTIPGTFSLSPLSLPFSHPDYPHLILNGTVDREDTAVHQIELLATSVPSTSQNTSFSLTVTVQDVNDNAPTFLNSYNESIILPDSTPPNDVIHSVECRDKDESSNGDVVYEILPQHHLFAVDVAGNILVHMPLDLPDFTLQETHNISILCRDMGVPPLSSTKTITVTVTKTDQQPPVVNISHTSTSLPEGAPRGTRVFTLSVYDVDSQAVSLAIINQTIPGTFSLSPLSLPFSHPDYPHLILNGTVDREDTAVHQIELLATTVPSTSQNTSFSLTVTVQDVNDNAPSCSRAKVTISAGFYNHAILLTLACSDEDKGLNQQLTYGTEGSLPLLSDGQFSLNQMSGELALDGEIAEGVYVITAVVSDQGTPPLHTSTVIEVEVISNTEGMSLIIIVILGVVALLVIVGVAIGCGLCCRIWACKRRRKHLVRY